MFKFIQSDIIVATPNEETVINISTNSFICGFEKTTAEGKPAKMKPIQRR
jgi:hypothetical protein